MTANAALVKMGVCNVTFDNVDIGYTKGFVKVRYSCETNEKTVDQLDTPIGVVTRKQVYEVEVPMAEYNLNLLVKLFPGATLITDGTTATKQRIELSGANVDLSALGKVLVLTPVGGDANDVIKLFKAVPQPAFDFTYDSDNVRVFNVKFTAVPDDSTPVKWVHMGDATAVA